MPRSLLLEASWEVDADGSAFPAPEEPSVPPGDVNMILIDKCNVGDGNTVHKGNVSDTNLVDKALAENVGETKDVDMLVVDNVVNSNLVDNIKGVSIDDEVLAKQMKLDKGKSAMTQKDHFISKKIKSVLKGNGIVIRENDNLSFHSDSDNNDIENKNDQENQVNSSGNETDMGFETKSYESKRSFDYLSDCNYEVIELRERKPASKNNINKGDGNASSKHEDIRPLMRNYDIGDSDTIKQRELCMEELMWKLKGNESGLTDLFTIVQKSCESFLTDPSDGRSTFRPADVLIFGWVGGKYACVDLTGVPPLVRLSSRGFTTGQAALKAALGKVTKHEKACIENQHVFIPFAFDTFGFLAPEAVELLSRVQRVMHSNVMTPRSTDMVFKRIGFAIQKRLAAQLVARLREQNGNSSSQKQVYFVNTVTIIRKEDEPKESRILESNAIENNDHGIALKDEKTIEKESRVPRVMLEKKETSDLGDEIYENLIREKPSCSLNFNLRIKRGDPSKLKIPCMIGYKFIANAYIDLDLLMNVMSLAYYNAIRNQNYEHKGINFVGIGKDTHVFIGNMSHVMDFIIFKNDETNIDPSLSQVVFGRPFVKIIRLTLDKGKGLLTSIDGIKEVTFKTPYRDLKTDSLTSEGHDLLSSRVILSDNDLRRGCKSPWDLKSRFYKDIDKLDSNYNWKIKSLYLEAKNNRTNKGVSNAYDKDDLETNNHSYADESVGVEVDFNNMKHFTVVSPIPTTRVHSNHPKAQIIGDPMNKARLVAQGHKKEDGIDYDKVFAHVARVEEIRLFLAFASYINFPVYQMDVKSAFLYGTIKEETKIHVDNESAICVIKNPAYHSKTKHIEIRHHFIRNSYEKRLIKMVKIHTDNNVAYLLTKAFDVSRFNFLVASTEQFWKTDALSTIKDRVMAITVTIDRNVKVLITEASIRRHPKLGDSEEETTLMPHDSPLQSVHSLGRNEGSLSLNELTVLCTSLSTKVQSLENELHQTKKVYSSALTKLILRVKKLERTVKTSKARRKARIVISEDKDPKDPSKQGMSLIEELDMDVDISLVLPHAANQERKLDDTQVSGQPEDQLGVFSAAKVLADAAEQRRISSADVSTASEMVNTAGLKARDKAQKLHDEELASFNAKQEAVDIARKEKVVAESDQAHDVDWSDPAVIRYHTLQNKPRSVAEDHIYSFVPMNSELEVQRSKRTVQEVERQFTEEEKGKKNDDSSKPTRKKTLARKRAGGNNSQESVKKQKLEDDTEKKELKAYLDITRVLTEHFMYYQIIRADRNSKNYKIFSEMLDDFDRHDIMDLHRLVEERYTTTSPEGCDLMLWGDLKTLFEPDEENELWKNQHEYNLISWRLCDSSGIHILLIDNGIAIHMLIEKKYPLGQEMISKMLNKRLEVKQESKMAFELLRQGVKSLFDREDTLTLEGNTENLPKLLERKYDELILDHELDVETSFVIIVKLNLTVKLQYESRNN
uniref:Putative reverse transcriptase domain-containing protein n=1 Tax=Tanacetum cinerariifolium TaxID=118510 RepID=A0A6L2KEE0_TANCI|nr:putative reverse transcriptase domain-containing protein [Tanacetum cinerariifolium]